jgi:hypothetical protein
MVAGLGYEHANEHFAYASLLGVSRRAHVGRGTFGECTCPKCYRCNGIEFNRVAHRGENDGRVSYWL